MAPVKDSILHKYFYPVGFALTGVASVIFTNQYLRRPWYAGAQRHVGYGIIGFMIGSYADIYLAKKWSERDAVIKHYIELHPEDFVQEKKQYKEIFDEWIPIR